MKVFRRTRFALLVLLAGCSAAVPAAPLTFSAALDLAENQSPGLAANAAQLSAAQSASIPAGALPDPKLVAGLENYPVTGPERGQLYADFMTMQKVGVMQDVPNAAKRRAREEVARASVAVVEAARRMERLKVRSDTALAWIRVYFLERKLSLFDELDQENRLLADAVRAQVGSGRGIVADLVIPKQEEADLADRRDDLARDLVKARAALRRSVGSRADDPLAGTAPMLSVDAAHLRTHLHHHPDLLVFDARRQRAESEVREADAEKQSDWGVEMNYEHRAPQFGDMVSIQFTFSLPVSTSTRQDPMIAARTQELTRIDAERDDMLRDHTRELESDLADYETLSRQWTRSQTVSVPLAREKMDLLSASYQAGRGDLTGLVAARRALVDERLKAIDLEGRRAQAAALLHYLEEEGTP